MQKYNNYKSLYKYIEPLEDMHLDKQYSSRYRISTLYKYLEKYLTITSNQLSRVIDEINTISTLAGDTGKYSNIDYDVTIYSGDLHFFIIALEKCYILSSKLYDALGCKQSSTDTKQSTAFINIKKIRNHLEHMNENLADMSTMDSKHPNYSPNSNWFDCTWSGHDLYKIEIITPKNQIYSLSLNKDTLNDIISHYDNITNIINEKFVKPNKELVDKILNKMITTL